MLNKGDYQWTIKGGKPDCQRRQDFNDLQFSARFLRKVNTERTDVGQILCTKSTELTVELTKSLTDVSLTCLCPCCVLCRCHLSSSLFCTLSSPVCSLTKWLSRWSAPLSHGQRRFTGSSRRCHWGGGQHEATPLTSPPSTSTRTFNQTCPTCYQHLSYTGDWIFFLHSLISSTWVKMHMDYT